MCINGHEPERLEIRSDGSRICGACREAYASRRRMYGKQLSNHRQRGETNNATATRQ